MPRYISDIFLAQKSRDQEVEFSPFYAPLVLPFRFMSVKYSVKYNVAMLKRKLNSFF